MTFRPEHAARGRLEVHLPQDKEEYTHSDQNDCYDDGDDDHQPRPSIARFALVVGCGVELAICFPSVYFHR